METTTTIPVIVRQKLEAFDRLQPEFEECFQFIHEVHGQRRFASFPVISSVRYLHALWVNECKGRLLSVRKTIKEYEGRLCLELLRAWQKEEDTGSVVDFLQRKLDMMPFGALTRQVQEARRIHAGDGLAERLVHGRFVLLNRGINLMQALDAIFVLAEEELLKQVRAACEQYGHLPVQVEQQLNEMDAPLYQFIPHQALAQRNMSVMNKLGVNVTWKPTDLPGNRSWRVLAPTEPLSPYAEHVVQGYTELIAPVYNNPMRYRFVDLPEHSEDGVIL